MPYSDNSNSNWYLEKLLTHRPRTILDVGPGAGRYASLTRSVLPEVNITGLEIFEPYVERFGLNNLYDEVIVQDVRECTNFNYDLTIFGDVLEHMTEEEAIEVWSKARKQSRNCIISIPTIHYPQGESEGNIHEVHVKDDWSDDQVLSKFEGIVEHQNFGITSSFWA